MDREKIKQVLVLPLVFVGIFYVTWVLRTGSFGFSMLFNPAAPPIKTAAQPETKAAAPSQTQGKPSGAAPSGGPPTTPKPVEVTQGEASFKGPLPVPVIDSWGRDPFVTPEEIASPVRAPLSPPDLRITSIIIQGANRVVTIGDNVIREGEMVGAEKVVEIREGGIVLSRGEEQRFLELPDSSSISIERKSP